MALGKKPAARKSKVVTKIEQDRAPGEESESDDEKFNEAFNFADNAADYTFDTWKNLTQMVKKKKKRASLSETIKNVVSLSCGQKLELFCSSAVDHSDFSCRRQN